MGIKAVVALGLWSVVAVGCASTAGGAPAANGGVTARAAAEEPRWSVTGQEVREAGEHAEEWYLLGILNAWELTDTVTCPKTLRRGTVIFQARMLMKEKPADYAIKSLVWAMGQLGCAWSRKPWTPPTSGPSS